MYYVYILKSLKNGRYYIGQSSDLIKRLMSHNSGQVKSTRNRGPWRIVYQERYNSRGESLTREKEIKSYKGGDAFKKLLGSKN